jgi:alpha-mannosidase
VQLSEIHLVHHSHTDVGFTHDQPVLWDLQRRFLDRALALADRDADRDGPDAFRWTVETTAPLLRWLDETPEEDVERFFELEARGRIEVTALPANVTPLYGPAETVEGLRPVRCLRERGADVRHAMNCDVNGQNWPLADALMDAGVEALSMAINDHFGGSPFDRPHVFRWVAPSGRELLALDGFHYGFGDRLGIGRDAEELAERSLPRLADHLDAVGYPLEVLPVQTFHPFGDNAPPADFGDFVREWNDREDVADGELPRIRLATPADFWSVVDEHRDALPTHRGDWTDFWNFGADSSARETAVNRESRRRLHTADALEAVLGAIGAPAGNRDPARRAAPETRERAWWKLLFYDEHTWGANTAVRGPELEDTRSQ